ncbi:hypothetical protein D1AOALGA4SA_7245 [Olavius algarvensis Delta 1 endosymbiont]|nr:hypothetical protein D1AOALGA4SA_7245 [Olavius algarvensis Delta 1 endosymbiont]
MTAEEHAQIRQNLLRRKSELWQEISKDLEDDAREEYQELVQSIRDGSDRAQAELEETTIISHVKSKVQEIDRIEEVLTRMDAGKYCSCRNCGGWIRPDRLMVVPCAVRCRTCQEKQEKSGRI